MYGYVSADLINLQRIPVINSPIERHLIEGDEFRILGYVTQGDYINGSARWYYIRTSMEAGNLLGFVHSSLITILP
jgi:hypothetical protein